MPYSDYLKTRALYFRSKEISLASVVQRLRDGSGIEDGPEVPEVQRQHNVQRTVRLRRVGVVTGHSSVFYTDR